MKDDLFRYDPFNDPEYLKLFEKYASTTYGLINILEPTVYYHYTKLDALLEIIRGNKLRFTRIDFLNDMDEYQYAIDLVNNLIHEENKYDNDYVKKIEESINSESFEKDIEKTYVLSLSTNADNLALWAEYSDGRGYNFGIFLSDYFLQTDRIMLTKEKNNKEYTLSLVENIEKEDGYDELIVNAGISFYRVLYDESHQTERVKNYLSEINSWFIKNKEKMDHTTASFAIDG